MAQPLIKIGPYTYVYVYGCVIVWSSKKNLAQSERCVPPGDHLISDDKVQAKFQAERKRDRIRSTKIKQDKIIDDRRCQSTLCKCFSRSIDKTLYTVAGKK